MVEITVRSLGGIPIIVEEVDSEKIWDEDRLSYQIKYRIRASFEDKTEIFSFIDSIQNYRCGIVELDGFLLAKAFHENLVSAYLHGTLSLDEYCRKFSMFSPEGCRRDYEETGEIFDKMRILLGINGFEMKDLASEIYELYGYFPAVRGEVIERW